MNWTHPPGPPGRRESWPPPPRTTSLSSIPCSAHFQGRRLPWLPTSQSCLAMGASPTPPPLPVWFPNAPTTAVSTLQSIQNSALRIATGSLKMASTDHLHQEASVLPVRAHLSMLCSQFLLSALRPNHRSHPTVTADSGPRNIRHTLQSRFRPSISAHLIDGITQPDSYRESLRRVHSDAVAAAIAPKRLLGVSPSAVSASERRLPRAHRTTLFQLRSGFSSAMRDYQHRIGAEPTPECPECADPCHSVPHLFSCPARPTDLSVGDMWERPLEVARFLLSVPSFSHFPEFPPPPPEPPHVPGGGISNNNMILVDRSQK